MKIFKKIIAMGVLSMTFSSAYAIAIPLEPEIPYGQTTIVDFEELSNSTQSSLTNKGVTFEAYAAGIDEVPTADFRIDSLAAGLFNTTGSYYLSSDYGPETTAFQTLRMSFDYLVSDFGFNFGASENVWNLEAFSAQGVLIDSLLISATGVSNAGDFFGISSETGISYALLTDTRNIDGPDVVTFDNLTFTTAVPEPSVYALMLGGLSLVGFMANRRRKNVSA